MCAISPSQSTSAVRFGGHSMTAKLRRVMVRQPASPMSDDEWQLFGYLHPVDHALTVRQHAAS